MGSSCLKEFVVASFISWHPCKICYDLVCTPPILFLFEKISYVIQPQINIYIKQSNYSVVSLYYLQLTKNKIESIDLKQFIF